MNSPFKFLDPFGPEDRDVFFGRDQEIEALYELALKGRLLLVYGLSGTGKTSLVQCGLRNRFDYTEWLPIFVRRGDHINRSLKITLAETAGNLAGEENLINNVNRIYKKHLRPVYITVDQLEELFILGDEAERDAFIQSLQELLHSGLDCHIILIIREEYLGRLYPFEKAIPSLFDYRLRVEPMNYSNVEKVIRGSCAQFNITLEEPERNTRQIIENVSSGRAIIQLPYLQVYLDRLWREVYHRSHAKASAEHPPAEASGTGYPPLTLSTQDIDRLGKIEDVLDKFLHDQEDDISKQLKQEYPGLPEQPVKPILDLFVTEEGTKRPVLFSRPEGRPVQLKGIDHTPVSQMPSEAVQEALTTLDKARILRIKGQQIELAHDSLAKLIDRDRSVEQRQRNQIRREVRLFYNTHREGGPFLTKKMVEKIRYGFPDLKLEPELEKFIDESKANYEREEQEKERQQRREQKVRRQRWFLGVIGTALVIAVGLIFWALHEKNIAERFAKAFFASKDEKFAWAYDFESEKFSVIDRSGSILNDTLWGDPKQFHNNTAIASRNGQYYWLRGDETISDRYSWLHLTDKDVYYGVIGSNHILLDTLRGKPISTNPSLRSFIDDKSMEDTVPDSTQLTPFWVGDQIGFKNLQGDTISPRYESYQVFFDTLAPVKRNDKWAYINQSGLRYGSVLFEKAVMEIPYNGIFRIQEAGKQGIAHIRGDEILFPYYQSIGNFSENLANVNKSGKWGFINPEGREVIRPVFLDASHFSEGLAAVQVDESWGFINKDGQLVIEPVNSYCGDFSEGLARVEQNNLYGYIDKKGKMVVPPTYEYAGNFAEGRAPVRKDQLWGFIDKAGKIVISPSFLLANNFREGWACVQKDNYAWAFIGLNGEETMLKDIQYAENLVAGRAIAKKNNLLGIIDSTGRFILPNKYTRIQQIGESEFILEQGNKIGLIAFKKDFISAIARELPCEYECISYFLDDYLIVKKNGKWGFVFWDDDSVEPAYKIDCRYDAVTPFAENGFARVYVEDRSLDFHINREGKMSIESFE